ncbi:MAG: hypothetical protein CVU65_17825 [Deltaproteobacteria bacterium HGW-Deltaproteobacteria-22]|nr:MAG: hypothetical protein CVU65_17825 [Deltaproteobacteria bacterium HGW-Deltaproteobacteria-22]
MMIPVPFLLKCHFQPAASAHETPAGSIHANVRDVKSVPIDTQGDRVLIFLDKRIHVVSAWKLRGAKCQVEIEIEIDSISS